MERDAKIVALPSECGIRNAECGMNGHLSPEAEREKATRIRKAEF